MGNQHVRISEVHDAVCGPGLIDFAPRKLAAEATLREANSLLAETAAWGVPLLDGDMHYEGMLTLRSLMAVALPVVMDDGLLHAPGSEVAALVDRLSRDRILDRPARLHLDLEVPVVRLSTRWPQLLAALCRRSPVVPIISDTGTRLIGVASLDRAAKALYGR
jgi:CBS domain-containing protein